METFLLFMDLIGKRVYPSDWVAMIMVQNRWVTTPDSHTTDTHSTCQVNDIHTGMAWHGFDMEKDREREL